MVRGETPACLHGHFQSIETLSEPAPVLFLVNISQHLHSPQAHIPMYIYRLLNAYIDAPQGLIFDVTLFLFYLPLKSIELNHKIVLVRHRHIQKRKEWA